jgi:acetylornithine/succinyldiaminopimelate/putrescine aminotransferase
VGVTTVTTMLEEKLPEHADRVGGHLFERLRAVAQRTSAIKVVRGKGLLVGLELDRPAGPVVTACREQGLLVLTAGDTVLRMTPPLVVQEADVDRAVDIVAGILGRSAP